MNPLRLLGTATLLFLAAAAAAHDFWIEPSTFTPAAGETVAVQLRSGENLEGRPVGWSAEWVERFAVRENGKETELGGRAGVDPAGWLVAGKSPAVIVYRSRPSKIELPAPRFDAYLREHGLEHVITLRAKRNESKKPGRELFSRCAKSLLGGAIKEPVGLRYEIVPESISATTFRGRVLFEGKPLRGALVVAQSRRGSQSARSDAGGSVTFTLNERGMWLIKSVHMIEAPPRSGAEWESLWASLTFTNG